MNTKKRKRRYAGLLITFLILGTSSVQATANMPDREKLLDVVKCHLDTYPDPKNNTYETDKISLHENCKMEDRGIIKQIYRKTFPGGILPCHEIIGLIVNYTMLEDKDGFNKMTGRNRRTGYGFAFKSVVTHPSHHLVTWVILDMNNIYLPILSDYKTFLNSSKDSKRVFEKGPFAAIHELIVKAFFDKKYDRWGRDEDGFDRLWKFPRKEEQKRPLLRIQMEKHRVENDKERMKLETKTLTRSSDESDDLYASGSDTE